MVAEGLSTCPSFITETINSSLHSSYVPEHFKCAVIRTLLKNVFGCRRFPELYGPVKQRTRANRCSAVGRPFQSLSWINTSRLHACHDVADSIQQIWSCWNSEVISLRCLEKGGMGVFIMFDLRTAFDTIDHARLLNCSETNLGVGGAASSCLASYLCDRTQTLCITGQTSESAKVRSCRKAQSWDQSCFQHTWHHLAILHYHSLGRWYPDLFIRQLNSWGESAGIVRNGIWGISCWMTTNVLQLNDEETEILVLTAKKCHLNISSNGIFTWGQFDQTTWNYY